MELFKKGLSCNDVKRWICEDGIETRPYGCNPSEEKDDVEMKEEDKDMEVEDNYQQQMTIKKSFPLQLR